MLAGGFSRLLLMAPVLWRAGWRWRPTLSLRDTEMLRLMHMMGLAVGTMMFSQVNIMVSNQFAMWMGEGIKTSLTFSQRLIQFPMALTATAAATGMLPQLTACLLEGRHRELRDLMAFTKRLEMLLVNPAMIGLMFFGGPILRLLFEHGNWTPQATHDTYIAQLWYSPCLLPMGWLRLVTPLFYARKDLYTPFKAAFLDLIFNIGVNWFFATQTNMQQGGLALANTISTLANYCCWRGTSNGFTRRRSSARRASGRASPRRSGNRSWRRSSRAASGGCFMAAWFCGWAIPAGRSCRRFTCCRRSRASRRSIS